MNVMGGQGTQGTLQSSGQAMAATTVPTLFTKGGDQRCPMVAALAYDERQKRAQQQQENDIRQSLGLQLQPAYRMNQVCQQHPVLHEGC